jgi:hypothetical protein
VFNRDVVGQIQCAAKSVGVVYWRTRVHVSKQKGIAPTLAWGSKMADSNMRIT